MLDAGFGLSDVTAALCERWQPGVRLLPMTDERCETHVVVDDPDDAPAPARRLRAQGASTSRSGGSSYRAALAPAGVRPGRGRRRRARRPA